MDGCQYAAILAVRGRWDVCLLCICEMVQQVDPGLWWELYAGEEVVDAADHVCERDALCGFECDDGVEGSGEFVLHHGLEDRLDVLGVWVARTVVHCRFVDVVGCGVQAWSTLSARRMSPRESLSSASLPRG